MWFGTRLRVCVFISDIIKYVDYKCFVGFQIQTLHARKEPRKKERKKDL